MEVKTTQKFILMSPRKIRQVVPMVANLKPADAIETLPLVGKRAAGPLVKVIKTAVANAKQKGVNAEDLIFKEIQIGEGPRLKRWRAGARGRAKPYKRKMSHIRVVLETKAGVKKPGSDKKVRASSTSAKASVDRRVKRSKRDKTVNMGSLPAVSKVKGLIKKRRKGG